MASFLCHPLVSYSVFIIPPSLFNVVSTQAEVMTQSRDLHPLWIERLCESSGCRSLWLVRMAYFFRASPRAGVIVLRVKSLGVINFHLVPTPVFSLYLRPPVALLLSATCSYQFSLFCKDIAMYSNPLSIPVEYRLLCPTCSAPFPLLSLWPTFSARIYAWYCTLLWNVVGNISLTILSLITVISMLCSGAWVCDELSLAWKWFCSKYAVHFHCSCSASTLLVHDWILGCMASALKSSWSDAPSCCVHPCTICAAFCWPKASNQQIHA